MLDDLHIDQLPTPVGMRRTLLLRDEFVAVAYTDLQDGDFIIAWPIALGDKIYQKSVRNLQHPISLQGILDDWLYKVLPGYGFTTSTQNIQLEYWMANHFYEKGLNAPVRASDILIAINGQRLTANDKLDLVHLNANEKVLEISFQKTMRFQYNVHVFFKNAYILICAVFSKIPSVKGN